MKPVLKILAFFCLLSCISLFSFSQEYYTTTNRKALKLFEEARQFYSLNDRAKAKQFLLEALEKDEKFVEAHTMLGYIY